MSNHPRPRRSVLARNTFARLGYRGRDFRGHKTHCGKCGDEISGGVTHPSDTGNPPNHALCNPCFDAICAAAVPSDFPIGDPDRG